MGAISHLLCELGVVSVIGLGFQDSGFGLLISHFTSSLITEGLGPGFLKWGHADPHSQLPGHE